MPVLKNARHELFCQAVAQGKELQEAYVEAGFNANTGNPSTLNKKTHVQRRIAELLNESASKIVEKVAIEVEYTRDVLLRKLEQAFGVAEKAKNGSAMAAAVIGMARITGQIIDRREVSQVGAFDHMTDEQLLDEAKKRSAELGIAFDPKLVN